VRSGLMLVINYYFALPIWLRMPVEEVIAKIPAWIIIVPNIIQSIVEFSVAWVVVFRTKLRQRIVQE